MMSGKRKTLFGAVALLLFASLPLQQSRAEDSPPKTVVLDSLVQYYKPVTFDHAMHVDMIGSDNCATCHHQTMGTPVLDKNCRRCHANSRATKAKACGSCHPAQRFSAAYLAEIESKPFLYHTDKPGLKGAFHQKCLGCHKKMDGPTGCEDCHARTEAGDKFYRSGKYAPTPSHASSEHE